MEKIFLDTNIFLDFYFDRKDQLKPLGEFAFKLIQETINCKYLVLTCKEVIKELCENSYTSEENVWKNILGELEKANKIEKVVCSEEQVIEANNFSNFYKIPKYDALFAILARDARAILVSRNWHFEKVPKIAEVFKPEELL